MVLEYNTETEREQGDETNDKSGITNTARHVVGKGK